MFNPNLPNDARGEALKVIDRYGLSDASDITAVINETLAFSEFEELGQFAAGSGFFERTDFSDGDLPMLPEIFSPYFGQIMAHYMSDKIIDPRSPTKALAPTHFVGLGAGGGFLDFDLIKELTSPDFTEELPGASVQTTIGIGLIGTDSRFHVTDLTDMGVNLLTKKLGALKVVRSLNERLTVTKMDAREMELETDLEQAYVYSNELIDAVSAEPVIEQDGKYWLVRMMPIAAVAVSSSGEIANQLGVEGAIRPENFKKMVEQGQDCSDLTFQPVFVPLFTDRNLDNYFRLIDGPARINNETHGGIIPLHNRIIDVFTGARESFPRGLMTFIDYVDLAGNGWNYNASIHNYTVGGYELGKMDIDFHIDETQIDIIAKETGFTNLGNDTLGPYLRAAITGDATELNKPLDPMMNDGINMLDVMAQLLSGGDPLIHLSRMADHHRILNYGWTEE